MTIEELLKDLAIRKAHANYEEMVKPYEDSYNRARDKALEILCHALGNLVTEDKIPLEQYAEAMQAWKAYQEAVSTSRSA